MDPIVKECARMLRQYPAVKRRISMLLYDVGKRQQELSRDVAASTAHIDGVGGGHGGSPGSIVERLTERRERIRESISEKEREVLRLREWIARVDYALSVMPDDARELLRQHYMQGKPWGYMADISYVSECSIRKAGNRALRELSSLLV